MKTIKTFRLLVMASVVFLCMTGFSQTTNSFFQFVNDQSERHYSNVPHEVLAIWYGWFGEPSNESWVRTNESNHEYEITLHHPVKTRYSSHDAAVIDWQIDQAKAYGITGFVASWMGKTPQWQDESLALLFERAEKKNFKVAVYWERNRDTGNFMIPFSVDDLSYILERYGKSPAFLKVDGKPVIFVYERVESQAPLATLAEIIRRTRARAGDFILIGHGYRSSFAYMFDGLHTAYSEIPFELLRNPTEKNFDEVRRAAALDFASGTRMARERSRIACDMIVPGFDNTKSSPAQVSAERENGKTYRAFWEEVIKTKPDWILISSWNEWAEGTEIEPSIELGDQYLQITAEYAKTFLESPTVEVPTCGAPPQFAPGTQDRMDRMLAGRTVGVMMQDLHVDAEFWSLYCGAQVRRLAWADLLNPEAFNARNFPILTMALNEHYTSSLKVTDDVTDSLIRYLHEGGFLVAVPFGTWPLYYDDSRKGIPFCITDKLALGVDNGFDQPPAGTELKFYVNTNVLLGLSSTAPFPTNGDLRFTPANRSRVPSSDYYLPLVLLWDAQMHHQGDAAVYIQHRTAPLSPGKSIYVWMRTAEALGSDEFYPSLYQFISTKLKPLPADK